jgi:hypothetical protein
MNFSSANDSLTLGFANWPNPIGPAEEVSAHLLALSLRREVLLEANPDKKVDICIESVYARNPIPTFEARAYRFLASHTKSGIDFSKSKYSPNQQPSRKANYSIFFTGENERPPYGEWDCYLSFDLNSYGGKNAYLPLWWITSSDLIRPTVSPYLGRSITLDEMLAPRESNSRKRNKFCVAFIGKAYPFRMQAIAALSALGKVDVFGGIARNSGKKAASEKYETSQKYKFVFAFENDLFPGYVTEKALEAWATGAIPLYWGSDPSGYLNQDAMINLANYQSLETFTNRVHEVLNNPQEWQNIASRPILNKRPNLDEVVSVIRTALAPLVRS